MTDTFMPKNEREFLNQVRKDSRERGWKYFHENYSMGSDKGFPDLFMVHVGNERKGIPGRFTLLVLELKTGKHKATEAQLEWIAALVVAGVVARIVRPFEYDDIIRLLDGLDVVEGNNIGQLEIEL